MGADGSTAAATHPWRRATAQVFVEDLADPTPQDADAHHLSRVLRLRAGELVCAADGAGGWRLCRFAGDGRGGGGGMLDPDGEVHHEPSPSPALIVGFVPVKGDRPEWVVSKLTELGVDELRVIGAQRAVVRWEGERAARHLDRLRGVARAAAAQCRRLWLPRLELGEGTAAGGSIGPGAAVLADAGGRPLGPGDTCVLVGPEGGWTDEERLGHDLVGVGEHVLRAETAAVAVGVLMTALRASLTTGR